MGERTIVIWNHEPYYESPAHKPFFVTWSGDLVEATLTLDVDPWAPPIGGCVYAIVLNGNRVSFTGDGCDVMTADVKPFLRNGENEIYFYFSYPNTWFSSGKAYCTLYVKATGDVYGGQEGIIKYILTEGRTLYCEDKISFVFELSQDEVEKVTGGKLHLDIDPNYVLPGVPTPVIVDVYLNGVKIYSNPRGCEDIAEADIDRSLFKTKNELVVTLQPQLGICSIAPGRISGYVDVYGAFPGEIRKAKAGKEPCKLLGILDIGELDPEQCGLLNLAIGVGGVLLIGLVLIKAVLK